MSAGLLAGFAALTVLLAVGDAFTRRIPVALGVAAFLLGLLVTFVMPFPWWHGWLAAFGALAALLAIRVGGLAAGRPVVGDGDALILGAFGAVLGLWILPVFAAGVLGALVVFFLIRKPYALPYTPYIVAPGLIAMVFLVSL